MTPSSRCGECPLQDRLLHHVPAKIVSGAKVIYVGEAPGKEEVQSREPFVGAAGRYLNECMRHAGIK
ncbi:MAG: uracil-DNA glycosylase, partial [Bacteroidetes bacterium]|nr:uracil-DNA glycosylase [Bacteroidota bacterium]